MAEGRYAWVNHTPRKRDLNSLLRQEEEKEGKITIGNEPNEEGAFVGVVIRERLLLVEHLAPTRAPCSYRGSPNTGCIACEL